MAIRWRVALLVCVAIAISYLDRLGTRRGFLVIMVFWSLACASHGLATNVWMLAASRFLLGAGEGGGFPAATKVIAERFPVKERSTAMGLVNAGTAVGAVVAPPAIAAILVRGSWRWVFIACGAAGLVWAIAWVRWYRDGVRPVSDQGQTAVRSGSDPVPAWSHLLTYCQVWGLVGANFMTDA